MAAGVTNTLTFRAERYKTFWERFWAGLIDALVLAIPFGIIYYAFFSRIHSEFFTVIWDFVGFFCVSAYSVLLHWRYGQTIGKRLVGVKVLDSSEKRLPSLRQAFLRDIGTLLIKGLGRAWTLQIPHGFWLKW